MSGSALEYEDDAGTLMEGWVCVDGGRVGRRPVVLVAHAWAGLKEHERAIAESLASRGWVGFAVDIYGKGRRGETREENAALMGPLVEDRALLRKRMQAAVSACAKIKEADTGYICAIGMCFGGMAVLELARSGAEVKGVASIHGLLGASDLPAGPVRAKVLALHGWDDPMAPPAKVQAFAEEMTAHGADWQLHAYGGTMHAFTNPDANDRAFGTVYSKRAADRAHATVHAFLDEAFRA